jgi:hypothetical protein
MVTIVAVVHIHCCCLHSFVFIFVVCVRLSLLLLFVSRHFGLCVSAELEYGTRSNLSYTVIRCAILILIFAPVVYGI